MRVSPPCFLALPCALLLSLVLAPPAAAQSGRYSLGDPATGERYNVELSGGLWAPSVEGVVASESLGIIGTEIDLVNDLGIVDENFPEFRAVLRPGRKHKFRVGFTPIKYETESTLRRNIVFNGIVFPIAIPVRTTIDWKAWRFGYEYDFIYRDRGFVGVIVEAKYMDVRAQLENLFNAEFTSVKVPLPAVGAIARGYIFPNVAITGELTGLKVPGDIADLEEDAAATYYELDVYGTLNFTDNVGVMGGYRKLSVNYRYEDDYGDFTLGGFYVQGVVRF